MVKKIINTNFLTWFQPEEQHLEHKPVLAYSEVSPKVC